MTTSILPMEVALCALAEVEQQAQLKLNANQLRRLLWIIRHNGIPSLWSNASPLPPQTGCVIVTDVLTGLESERLFHSLSADAVVILPYSEDPLFDPLKANFFAYGTVGAAGAEGPHQFWWGGRRREYLGYGVARRMPIVASSYSPGLVSSHRVRRLIASAEALELDHAVSPCDAITSWETGAAAKARYIWNVWMVTDRPVLWVEADSMLHGCPALPAALDCDFAVHKGESHAFDGSVLYFGRSSIAETLLRTWHSLCLACPGVSDGTLLDQAWSLVATQCDLDTAWLPRSYCSHHSTWMPGEDTVIFAEETPRRLQTLTGESLSLLAHDASASWIAARGHGRTGAPEAQLVIRAEAGELGPVAVLVQDPHSVRPLLSSAVLETIAAAFAEDSGGFSHLETVLCSSAADFQACIDAMQDFWVVVTTPAERFSSDTFRTFGNAIRDRTTMASPPTAQVDFNNDGWRHHFPPARALTNVKSSETFLTRASAMRSSVGNATLA